MSIVLFVHAFATCALMGLIWFVQRVQYPILAEMKEGLGGFHASHCRRITGIVGPLMAIEGISALLLFVLPLVAVDNLWLVMGLALIAVNAGTTAFVFVPLHEALGHEAQAMEGTGTDTTAELGRRLVRWNWIRTAAWTARGVLSLALLLVEGSLTSSPGAC